MEAGAGGDGWQRGLQRCGQKPCRLEAFGTCVQVSTGHERLKL